MLPVSGGWSFFKSVDDQSLMILFAACLGGRGGYWQVSSAWVCLLKKMR
jgi:hypothetical protein